ncbi:hypothetical protein IAU59_007357 [Kwoniella sp. CBS 9459]
MTTLLTLPSHLKETIQELLAADVDLAPDLRQDLQNGIVSPSSLSDSEGEPGRIIRTNERRRSGTQRTRSESRSQDQAINADGDESIEDEQVIIEEGALQSTTSKPKKTNSEAGPEGDVDTISLEVIERLSRWCSTEEGRRSLEGNNLDLAKYNLISLLAGTEVYIPPAELERLGAAENPDKPNPYLPSYFSPVQPSIGSEYRSMTKQLTTALNIIFSIVGSGAAVYVASTSGAGYTRETAVLLAVLTGVVVGFADLVLVTIFSQRVEEGRKQRFENSVKMLKGSGKVEVGEQDETHAANEQEEKLGKALRKQIDLDPPLEAKEGTTITTEPATTTTITTGMEKRQVRLRRKKLDEP